jgi:DHA1 family bicyclomycin/chloramphenicol resistance-like MFS transporter
MFAFLSGSSFVLIEFFGVKPEHFGLFFACVVAGYIGGNLTAIRLGKRLASDQILVRGLAVCATGALVMVGLVLDEVDSVWSIILPQMLCMIGVGMVLPQTMAGALASFPSMAGSASALFGFIQMVVAAGIGVLVGYFHNGTPLVMAAFIGICAVGALAVYLVLVRKNGAANLQTA